MLHYVLIRRSGMTTTGAKDSWGPLAVEIAGCLKSHFHNPDHDPVRKIFVGQSPCPPSDDLEEYERYEIESEAALHRKKGALQS